MANALKTQMFHICWKHSGSMAKQSAIVQIQIETKITCVWHSIRLMACVCHSIRLMAIVGFRLPLLCTDVSCAIRLCCPCPGKAKLGDDHPDTLQSLNNLALILADQGHLAEAEDLYQKALKKSREPSLRDFKTDFG